MIKPHLYPKAFFLLILSLIGTPLLKAADEITTVILDANGDIPTSFGEIEEPLDQVLKMNSGLQKIVLLSLPQDKQGRKRYIVFNPAFKKFQTIRSDAQKKIEYKLFEQELYTNVGAINRAFISLKNFTPFSYEKLENTSIGPFLKQQKEADYLEFVDYTKNLREVLNTFEKAPTKDGVAAVKSTGRLVSELQRIENADKKLEVLDEEIKVRIMADETRAQTWANYSKLLSYIRQSLGVDRSIAAKQIVGTNCKWISTSDNKDIPQVISKNAINGDWPQAVVSTAKSDLKCGKPVVLCFGKAQCEGEYEVTMTCSGKMSVEGNPICPSDLTQCVQVNSGAEPDKTKLEVRSSGDVACVWASLGSFEEQHSPYNASFGKEISQCEQPVRACHGFGRCINRSGQEVLSPLACLSQKDTCPSATECALSSEMYFEKAKLRIQ